MSEYFRNAREFTITDGNFNQVGRDQYIHHHHTTQIIQKAREEPTIFDDVDIVKSSAICRMREVHVDRYEDRRWLERRYNADRTICVAQVVRGSGVSRMCTVVSYTGPDRWKEFVEDYLKRLELARTTAGAQVYAVDIGSVPSMIYWNELVPAVVLKGNCGVLGRAYLSNLRKLWGCSEDELWMDASRGVICRGPKGPCPDLDLWPIEIENVPSTVDLLQEDVFVRFLASYKSKEVDHKFMYAMRLTYVIRGVSEIRCDRCDQPTVFSTLTQTPIAVANNVWENDWGSLSERTVLENGMTRFRLDGDATDFDLRWNWYAEKCWLSQASGIFHALGIEDNFDDFHLVWHRAYLEGNLPSAQVKQRLEQPIFLFVRPPPPNLPNGDTSSLHYWCFAKHGQNPLLPDICDQFGLPKMLKFKDYGYCSTSRCTNTYKLLHEYQHLRGFDPNSPHAEFAQHVGFDVHIFQPSNSNHANQFEELDNEQNPSNHETSAEPLIHLLGGGHGKAKKKTVVIGTAEPPPKRLLWPSLKRGWLCPVKKA